VFFMDNSFLVFYLEVSLGRDICQCGPGQESSVSVILLVEFPPALRLIDLFAILGTKSSTQELSKATVDENLRTARPTTLYFHQVFAVAGGERSRLRCQLPNAATAMLSTSSSTGIVSGPRLALNRTVVLR